MFKFAKATLAIVAASMLALAPVAAQAATPGVGDASNAVRYGASDPLGTRITDFTGEDDTSTVVDAPFAMNFFGEKYDKLCISINGGVFPTNDSGTDCAAYDYDVAALAGAAEAPMVAVLALDIDLSMCDTSLYTDTNTNSNVDEGELIDDGFALPCSVYWGTTTVDGHDAVVVTWYRVPNNDGGNDPLLSNTFQLLLIKRDSGDSTIGYDFDFEFNYATLKDDEDGYALNEDGTYTDGSCDAYTENNGTYTKNDGYDLCRWGVGVGNYTVSDGGTVGYEFFDQYTLAQLIDTGDTAMIHHRLGSTVDGRYRCGMINGVASGCEFSAALAETGTDAANYGYLALGLLAVGGVAVAARRRKA